MMKSLKLFLAAMAIFFAGMLLPNSSEAQNKITFLNNQSTLFPGQGDMGWVSLLQSKGYTVTRDTLTVGTRAVPLTQGQIAALNTADLIIIGRTTASGNFSDTAGFNQGITKPLIALSPHICRSSDRLNWMLGSNFDNGGSPVTKVLVKTHLIFTGITIGTDSSVQMIDSSVGPNKSTSLFRLSLGQTAGNATVLAMQSDTTNRSIAIAYWPAGTAFSSPANTAGGKRMWFNAGTYDNNAAFQGGSMNLTAAGQKIFLNAVQYMITGTVGVAKGPVSVVKEFALDQNYPNPFNPSTSITYQVSKEEFVSLKVYDLLGHEVATLVNEVKHAGSYSTGCNASGMCSGIYFYKMQASSFSAMRKMLLLK